MERSFWVLERNGRYIALVNEPTQQGGWVKIASWTDEARECRHWPTYQHADDERRHLPHPFWMADPVEYAWITDYGDAQ